MVCENKRKNNTGNASAPSQLQLREPQQRAGVAPPARRERRPLAGIERARLDGKAVIHGAGKRG